MKKIQRDFVWGNTPSQRKVYLVNWEVLCRPKDVGGLGFKSVHPMNKPFLLKLGWQVLTKPNELWVQVLWSKYGRSTSAKREFICKDTDLHLLKNIAQLWSIISNNIKYEVGNGQEVLFWTDLWLFGNSSLEDRCLASASLPEKNVPGQDVVRPNGEWDMDKFRNFVPIDIIKHIHAILPPLVSDVSDIIVWVRASGGKFSVKKMPVRVC